MKGCTYQAGQEVGKVRVLRKIAYDAKQRHTMYEIKCTCGATMQVRSDQVESCGVKGCFACRSGNKETPQEALADMQRNLTGFRVLRPEGSPDNHRLSNSLRRWECACISCGARYSFSSYNIKRGRVRRCECERRREYLKKHKVDEAMLQSLSFRP